MSIRNDRNFNLEFRYHYFGYRQILRSLAIVFVLIPFLPHLSSFLFSFQRKSLVSESWKRLYECHCCAPFRNSWRFTVYPLFRSVIHRGRNVHISTQVSSNQPNISDKNEIKFQKWEQRTVRFLFGFFNIFQNFLYTPQFLNRKSKYYTTNAIETMIIFKIFSRSGQVERGEEKFLQYLGVNILTISGVIIATLSGGQNRGKLDY